MVHFSRPPRLSGGSSLALGAATLLALAGCGRASGTQSDKSSASTGGGARPAAPATVLVVTVRPGLDPSQVLTTFLEPASDAPVVARHAGIVQRVYVAEGRRVGRGTILARLDDDRQRLVWERAQALAAQARAEYERARKAIAGNLISQHELEVAEARERAARAESDLARLECERCIVRSPVAGMVRLARAQPNMVVQEDEVLFRVADTSRLKASLYLPSGFRRRLAPGDAVAVVSLSDPSTAPARGRVRLVNPMADPITGLFHVEIDVPAQAGFNPGDDVRLSLGSASAPGSRWSAASGLSGAVLPRGAYLERSADTLFVYRIEKGFAHRVSVELGDRGADGFAILSGLVPGDLVVASGQLPPANGAPVRAQMAGVR